MFFGNRVGSQFGAIGPTEAPLKPIEDMSLADLTCKVVFLVTITSATQVSELAALSCKEQG